jgi:hypothetical protein
MHLRRTRSLPTGLRAARRVLLVGHAPLSQIVLERHLSEVAAVRSVSFPGAAFDEAVEAFQPHLVLVDVTYLDRQAVRPLITHRFLRRAPLVVYVDGDGVGRFDDLRAVESGVLADASVAGLVRLAAGASMRAGASS